MSEHVQGLQHDTTGIPGNTSIPESETGTETTGTQTVTETTQGNGKRKRSKNRRFRPDEILIANQFKDAGPMDEQIKYSDMTPEMRKAVFFNTKMRLVDRGILVPDYDMETGKIEGASVNSEAWAEYADDLAISAAKPISARGRNPVLSEQQFKIAIMRKSNPHKEQTRAAENWQHCYQDGMSVPDYLDFQDYPREIKVLVKNRLVWFNGPAQQLLYQDLKRGYVEIYNSNLHPDDPEYKVSAAKFSMSRDYPVSEFDENGELDELDDLADSGENGEEATETTTETIAEA